MARGADSGSWVDGNFTASDRIRIGVLPVCRAGQDGGRAGSNNNVMLVGYLNCMYLDFQPSLFSFILLICSVANKREKC